MPTYDELVRLSEEEEEAEKMAEPEPSFLGLSPQEWGRVGSETGGALIGGTLGLPGGIPGVMVGAGLGGETAGAIYDRLGGQPARSPMETVTGVALNTMGGPIPAPTGMAGSLGRNMSDELLLQASKEAGIPPLTPGQRGSGIGQRVEGWLESTATGGRAIDEQREGVEDSMRRYIDEVYPFNLSRQEVGGRLAGGIEDTVGVKDRATGLFPQDSLKGRASGLYDRMSGLIDPEGRINLPRSTELLEEHDQRLLNDPDYAKLINTDPDMKRYLGVLSGALEEYGPRVDFTEGGSRVGFDGNRIQPITGNVVQGSGKDAAYPLYDTIKQFRTNVGSKLDDPFVTATGGIQGEKKKLYGALSDDLAQGAEDIGGAEARQARSRADWFNRGLMDRLEKIDPVFRNADNPTKVYDTLSTMVMNDPDKLLAVKKTVPEDVWEDFTSSYMRKLLSATPGAENLAGDAVSYHTIATNINKLKGRSPEGLKIIAGDTMGALENISVLANRFRESEKFFNRSRTANAMGLGRLGGDALLGAVPMYAASGGDPMQMALSASAVMAGDLVVPWLASKVVTNPSIRKAVEKMPVNLLGDMSPATVAKALIAAGADEAEVAELLEQQ